MFEEELLVLKNELILRGYSPKTIQAYQGGLRGYFDYLRKWDVDRSKPVWERRMEKDSVMGYLLMLHDLGKAPNTVNLHMNTILFYLRHVCMSPQRIKLPFAKKPKRLPVILSRSEIGLVLEQVKNPKHYLMIALAYGAGLRVSEVVALKVENLDFEAGLIRIRQAKGKKDRVTVLPKCLENLLRRFTAAKQPHDYVFHNEQRGPFYERALAHVQDAHVDCVGFGERLSVRTAQALFRGALVRAGIQKSATFHSLRHSFATHMLEKGVDIHQLQILMGHNSIKTTQGYLHVTPKSLMNLESPL